MMKTFSWVEVSTDLSSINLATVEPESPDGLLYATCLSCTGDENETTDGSEAISSPESSNISKWRESFHDDGNF